MLYYLHAYSGYIEVTPYFEKIIIGCIYMLLKLDQGWYNDTVPNLHYNANAFETYAGLTFFCLHILYRSKKSHDATCNITARVGIQLFSTELMEVHVQMY